MMFYMIQNIVANIIFLLCQNIIQNIMANSKPPGDNQKMPN